MNEKTKFQKILLGFQHVLAMFGATVLVPALTGLDTSITLFAAGMGTIIFHLLTKKKVPAFLGSSFAFMDGIIAIIGNSRVGDPDYISKLQAVKGALIVAGAIYVIAALIIKLVGYEKVGKLLPPIVTGPMIIVIGLRLSASGVGNAITYNGEFNPKCIIVTAIVLITVISVSVFGKGLMSNMPILMGIIVGFIICIPLGFADFTPVSNAKWLAFTDQRILDQLLCLPTFKLDAILAIAPIALVTLIEHVGDITTIGAVVGKDFFAEPGVHRTILGEGVATMFAGLIGGPANTTYGENTGVLAVTKNYDPGVIRIAAVIAMILGVIGKLGAVITSIPTPVTGAISIVLYGMISAVGVRILVGNRVNFGNSRNLMIAALILVIGIGCDSIPIKGSVSISGLAIAAVLGIALALILPEGKDSYLPDKAE